ncbi:preprotein translocase subunit SecE [Helicovermis profundi]|uniref:Protein translocase subunit SecE n=1 Tax=Helicovermis profundi TaxID=3065157 RepID=A0AAU9EBE4_9FIRM|nr:hypothetical protein HLPR_24730 [Clostridia bacterium S502]
MATQSNAVKKEGGKFFKGIKSELKKVNWPNRKEVINNTVVVLTVCVLTSVAIGVLDLAFKTILKMFM